MKKSCAARIGSEASAGQRLADDEDIARGSVERAPPQDSQARVPRYFASSSRTTLDSVSR